ncbi:MAG: hypothetical protein A2Y24_06675 [Clostridiales bacterium GWE2_32_10]|nr:MAG: hypothetical protein A2Y24_06675 [Clostridiales bacterium GWE2_32_10]HBY20515.1 ribosome maturation factor RimP [Clostridiales bacterium]
MCIVKFLGGVYLGKAVEIEKKVENLIKPIIEENNLELVDVEYVKEKDNYYLKIFIDKEGGIFISDCEDVSRVIDKELDELNFIKDVYILEVSSPGLDRQLRKEKEFVKYKGRLVDVKLYQKINGIKEFQAELVGLKDGKILLKSENGENLEYSREEVAVVRLAVII